MIAFIAAAAVPLASGLAPRFAFTICSSVDFVPGDRVTRTVSHHCVTQLVHCGDVVMYEQHLDSSRSRGMKEGKAFASDPGAVQITRSDQPKLA